MARRVTQSAPTREMNNSRFGMATARATARKCLNFRKRVIRLIIELVREVNSSGHG